MAISTSGVVVAQDIHDLRGELNQIYWDIFCNRRESYIQRSGDSKISWILADRYKDSRTNVIGKAIGDCVAGKNEFEEKTAEDIITFEKTSPEDYEPKHWNAVILYNYVHEAINNSESIGQANLYDYLADVNNVLKNKLKKIKEYYMSNYQIQADKLQKSLDTAVQDIQKYVNALRLFDSLRNVIICKRDYHYYAEKTNRDNFEEQSYELNLAPEIIDRFVDCEKSKQFAFNLNYKSLDNVSNIETQYRPRFAYYDNKLYITGLLYRTAAGDAKPSKYTEVSNLNDIQQLGGWILERLKGVAELPTEYVQKVLLEDWKKCPSKLDFSV